jgi:hypothetical protein
VLDEVEEAGRVPAPPTPAWFGYARTPLAEVTLMVRGIAPPGFFPLARAEPDLTGYRRIT